MSRRISPPFLASTLATALLLAGCEAPSSSPGLSGLTADTGGQPSGAPARALLDPGCTARTFRQPISSGKLDLLFVTDTSGSLAAEREEIAEGIDHFIRALPEGQDIRIGVMLAHSPLSPYSGRLWRSDGGMIRGFERSEPWVLSTIDMPRGYVRAKLRQKLRWQESEYISDGGEFGMGSLLSGLDSARLAESRAKGFFRTDAALAVVFVSDENDICAEYPAGVTPVFDPDGLEAPAKRRFCTVAAGITSARVLSRLRELQSGRPLVVGGIQIGRAHV